VIHLSVEEAKELSESVADVRQTQQHQRNADDRVRDTDDTTPERLRRNIPVTCKRQCTHNNYLLRTKDVMFYLSLLVCLSARLLKKLGTIIFMIFLEGPRMAGGPID